MNIDAEANEEDNPANYSDWTEIQNFKTNCDAFIENFSGVGINQITVHVKTTLMPMSTALDTE